tara:strand:- start:173 stop:388 length:216 start_codon:yes stop_codon:yes gene_type:complete
MFILEPAFEKKRRLESTKVNDEHDSNLKAIAWGCTNGFFNLERAIEVTKLEFIAFNKKQDRIQKRWELSKQ